MPRVPAMHSVEDDQAGQADLEKRKKHASRVKKAKKTHGKCASDSGSDPPTASHESKEKEDLKKIPTKFMKKRSKCKGDQTASDEDEKGAYMKYNSAVPPSSPAPADVESAKNALAIQTRLERVERSSINRTTFSILCGMMFGLIVISGMGMVTVGLLAINRLQSMYEKSQSDIYEYELPPFYTWRPTSANSSQRQFQYSKERVQSRSV